jgi:GT2 family glycosyltransferase
MSAPPEAPVASVVVPTHDRPHRLRSCLAALAAQSSTPLEIVVVDDASVDRRALATTVAGVPGARIVAGDGRGPAAARNRGAAAARGRVLCFTDDDCRPDRDWVAALVAAVEAGSPVVAGSTRAGPPGDRCATATQTITNHLMAASLDPATGYVRFAPTCNVACAAGVARDVPFDEAFPLAAGEDREWCARLAERGVRIRLVPDARVAHHPAISPAGFWRQHVRYGRGAARWRRRRERGERWQPAAFYVGLVRAGFAAGPTVGVLVAVAQAATAVGLAAETARGALPIRRRRSGASGAGGRGARPTPRDGGAGA